MYKIQVNSLNNEDIKIEFSVLENGISYTFLFRRYKLKILSPFQWKLSS